MFNIFKRKEEKPQRQKAYIPVKYKNYAAAEENRMTLRWTNYKFTSDQIIKKYFTSLVARSCEQCMNNPYARKFLLLLENNVIGDSGIKLQAQAKDQNGKLDQAANDAQESAWKQWGEVCDVTGKLNYTAFCKLLIKTCAREGEGLIRIATGKEVGPWGFALQLLDPRRLDINKNEDNLPDGRFIRFGIEYNRYGKPLFYYIKKSNDDSYYCTSGSEYDVIPAEEIIHGFISEYIDQKRGLPWFSTVLMRMNMLGGFEEAAVEHARAGACQMGFITNDDPEAYEEDEDNPQDIDIDASPASFHVLPPGYKVNKYDPNYPNGEFDAFSKAILRGIAAGLGPGYNTLACDLTSVNFSSLRQGILDERETWKGLQEWFIATFEKKFHDKWLKYSLLNSKIKCGNGYLKPERFDKYKEVTWTPRRWLWVDPVKDVNSATVSVQNAYRSRSDVIREQGRDPEEVWNEIEKENEMLRVKGILIKDEVIKDVGEKEEQ